MKATLLILATFDYENETSYAEHVVEITERARELCTADVINVARGVGIAAEGHIESVADLCPLCGKWDSPEHRALSPKEHIAQNPNARV